MHLFRVADIHVVKGLLFEKFFQIYIHMIHLQSKDIHRNFWLKYVCAVQTVEAIHPDGPALQH